MAAEENAHEPSLPTSDPEALVLRFKSLWERTDEIFDLVTPEAMQDRPIALRQPFLFYLGHLPAFLYTQLQHWASLHCPEIDAELVRLFERGIDPDVDTGTCHANSAGTQRAHSDWPSVDAVLSFRDQVRARTPEMIRAVARGERMLEHGRIFELVVEHELMHQETLLYMVNCLPLDRLNRSSTLLRRAAAPPFPPAALAEDDASYATVPGTCALKLGRALSDPAFGWDNEFPEQIVAVDSFAIRRTPICNGEWLAFVEAGGYKDERYWEPEDWAWLQREKRQHPQHWVQRGDHWFLRTVCRELPLPRDWPVQITLAEARAWCRWQGQGVRLPTEAEWVHAAYYNEDSRTLPFPWGEEKPTNAHGNFDLAQLEPCPVRAHHAGCNSLGLWDLLGNGWEWTATPFAGFEGFKAFLPTYPGYSADFFDGKHFVLRGGSFATPAQLLRRGFRNWYQARYPYAFAKFRPARSLQPPPILRLDNAPTDLDARQQFSQHVKAGMAQSPPLVSSMWLYDSTGSAIYEEITRLEEYYPTRTEYALLSANAKNIVAQFAFVDFNLVELGAGDGHKTQVLLDAFLVQDKCPSYYPIDISEAALRSLLGKVRAPQIKPIVAHNLDGLAHVMRTSAKPTLVLFLGSSIGNYDPSEALAFLQEVAARLREGDSLFVGFDLKKDPRRLVAAYNDAKGTTARFNYNLLTRMNRELGANFDLSKWRHVATWNPTIAGSPPSSHSPLSPSAHSSPPLAFPSVTSTRCFLLLIPRLALESWLIPTTSQHVSFDTQLADLSSGLDFQAWEGFRVERSYKFSLRQIEELCAASGFDLVSNFALDGFCDSLWLKSAAGAQVI